MFSKRVKGMVLSISLPWILTTFTSSVMMLKQGAEGVTVVKSLAAQEVKKAISKSSTMMEEGE
jgi:hypothetical protein